QPELAPEAVDLLPALSETYQLEGLELQLRMALLRAGGRRIEARDLTSTSEPAPLGRTLASVEREHVEAVLVATGNNRAQAARELGINRSTLYNKLRDWNGGA
ncbi:MAG: helix-turn-helix domain-containing protein, partial [Planctomycetota bacterium]